MVGRKEEQRGKVRPGKVKLFLEKFKLVLKAQKGMRAEVHGDEMCGGWLIVDVPAPIKNYFALHVKVKIFQNYLYFLKID